MKVSDRVKHARESADMSKADLARACSVSKQAIGQIENGTTKSPNPTTLFSIAKATGFNAEWIATGNGPQKTVASGSGSLAKARQQVKEPDRIASYDKSPVTNSEVIAALKNKASPRTRALLQKLAEIDRESGLNDEHIEILEHLVSRYETDKP